MKTTLQKAGAIGALSIAALGVMSASAMGFPHMNTMTPDEIATQQSAMFTSQASLIGATVDEVKNAWAQGKSFQTLATEKGVTKEQLQAKMLAKRTDEMKSRLATLVSKGVITQAQADQRIAYMQTKQTSGKMAGKHGMREGMMGGF